LPALGKELQELTEDARVSPLADVFLNAMEFYLSDRWVRF